MFDDLLLASKQQEWALEMALCLDASSLSNCARSEPPVVGELDALNEHIELV